MQLEQTSLQHKMKALVIEPFTIEEVATEEIGRGGNSRGILRRGSYGNR